MTKSRIFRTSRRKQIERAIMKLLSSQPDFLSARSAPSPRAAGDAIQSILSENFQSILGDLCANYSSDFARRAMADLAFTDQEGLYYVIDVKTHRVDAHFSMPNLTSVERLARFYEDDRNYFAVLIVKYSIRSTKVTFRDVTFVPIEFLAWDCLTIGALGWGQIQIANASTMKVTEGYARRRWMVEFCDVMLEFYPRELGKIGGRIEYFKKVRSRWLGRKE